MGLQLENKKLRQKVSLLIAERDRAIADAKRMAVMLKDATSQLAAIERAKKERRRAVGLVV